MAPPSRKKSGVSPTVNILAAHGPNHRWIPSGLRVAHEQDLTATKFLLFASPANLDWPPVNLGCLRPRRERSPKRKVSVDADADWRVGGRECGIRPLDEFWKSRKKICFDTILHGL